MVNFSLKDIKVQDVARFRESLLFSRLKRRILAHVLLVRLTLGVAALGVVLGLAVFTGPSLARAAGQIFFFPKMIVLFLFGNPAALPNKDGKTNILILGEGGAGHEASQLTDTMLFLSLDSKNEHPVFLSLPRDIWVGSMRAKLNTAYYYGNQKREGGGLILAKASVSEILDQPVHWAAVLDFSGFVKLVDLVGGIEIEVERTLDDFKYPIPGRENDLCNNDPKFACRYEHLHFERGKQTMDGQTTLRFVRSRNAEGEEGTDFARSTRQQKVVLAIKQKLLSPSVILNPGKIRAIFEIVNESLKMDIPQDKLPILARLFLKVRQDRIKSLSLDGGGLGDAQTGFLVNPPISGKYDNQWVLFPRDSTWEEVRAWIKEVLYP